MTNPTPHGQVPEALIDLIDAYAETRHRYGGIYNARTEAARNAVIAALKAFGAQRAVSWARPVFATEPAEAWDVGDLVDVEFHNHPEKPEGGGWRPLVFADTGGAPAESLKEPSHDAG